MKLKQKLTTLFLLYSSLAKSVIYEELPFSFFPFRSPAATRIKPIRTRSHLFSHPPRLLSFVNVSFVVRHKIVTEMKVGVLMQDMLDGGVRQPNNE
jgi:hypothetical protein